MKKLLAVTLLTVSALALSLPAVNSHAGAHGATPTPPGSWSLFSAPYIDEHYSSHPLVVHAVTTTSTDGPVITAVQLRNRSAAALNSVSLRWYLAEEGNPGVVLLRGDTKELPIAGGLLAGGTAALEYEVVSFGRLREQLKAAGLDRGAFRLDVGVAFARFAGGRTWAPRPETRLNYPRPAEPRFLDASYTPALASAPEPRRCPFTTCRNIGSPPWVECGSTTSPISCSVVYTPTLNCTVTACG